MTGGCLGETAAAFVDGELDHGARERALRHLTHCPGCRAEVDAQRRLKAQLFSLAATPAPAQDLTVRLLALTAAGPDSRRPAGPSRPVSLRRAAGPRGTRPAGRRAARRRTAAGSALLALGAVAVVLGGPQGPVTTPVDPATDSFVVQHVDTTNQVPRVLEAQLTGGGPGNAR
ncbi:MAG: zf-HC2 domain-containing protein [Mycobacteriales bacterium]